MVEFNIFYVYVIKDDQIVLWLTLGPNILMLILMLDLMFAM